MTERLPCANPDCDRTILPLTAEETGGLCMVCVREANQRRRQGRAERSRREIDPFAGVTDPVEILEIQHRPPVLDPQVVHLPCRESQELVYAGLDADGERRLADLACGRIGGDRHREAVSMLRCLAAFRDARLDDALRELVAADCIEPALAFRRAPADVRDELVRRVESGAKPRPALAALAWIGDGVVVELFGRLRDRPPAWASGMAWPPWRYAQLAGWELGASGERRDLVLEPCTSLLAGASDRPDDFRAVVDRSEACDLCGVAVVDMIELRLAAFDLDVPELELDRVRVPACEACSTFGEDLGRLGGGGRARRTAARGPMAAEVRDPADWGLRRDPLSIGPRRAGVHAADEDLPTTSSQVGGHPTWIQDVAYPACPECERAMTFLAQLDHGEIEKHGEGITYLFLCGPCRTTAASFQQT